jgi:DNA-binding transcriptional MerR regulator
VCAFAHTKNQTPPKIKLKVQAFDVGLCLFRSTPKRANNVLITPLQFKEDIVTINTFVQDTLFDDEPMYDFGFRAPAAAAATGVSYRQLDYWARTNLVNPELQNATGSGSQRLYSFRDLILLRIVKRLLSTGISLQQIRIAINYLRTKGVNNLLSITLLSDGVSVYEATDDNELLDIVKGGQGVFAITLRGVVRDVESSIAELPVVSQATQIDELAMRRVRKSAI